MESQDTETVDIIVYNNLYLYSTPTLKCPVFVYFVCLWVPYYIWVLLSEQVLVYTAFFHCRNEYTLSSFWNTNNWVLVC